MRENISVVTRHLAVVQGLSCSVACGIFLDQRSNLYSGAGGVQTAKASRKQSSLSGKEIAQGCLPKRLLGRPD